MKALLVTVALCLAGPAVVQGAAKPRVRIDTSYGPFVVELEPDLVPKTVANFLQYVHEGFYTDTIFHRVIAGFVIQGGGLRQDMVEKPLHPPIPNEEPAAFKAGLKNVRYTIAMARTDKPDSGAAQFFINTADNQSLDPGGAGGPTGYCVFGRVVAGTQVVDKIEQVHTVWYHGMQNVPEYPVRIKSAQQLEQE